MELVYLGIGIVLGAALMVLVLYGKKKELEGKIGIADHLLQQEQIARENAQKQIEQLQGEANDLVHRLTETRLELERTRTSLQGQQQQSEREDRMRQEQFQEQLRTVQEHFSNMATAVLQKTAEHLKTSNVESMEHITHPLTTHIEQLRQAIQNTNQENVKNTASLSEQLRNMREQTQRIDQTATRLTNVIRGEVKAQGRWGERMLSEILEAQGFRAGFDYDVQETLIDDDSGKRMIPDVILHYPGNEDVVIDSKMSIDAYYQYVNTEDENLRGKYADDLVRSVRTQMINLSKKDYSRYIRKPRRAIDFVIMFVPNDGALQLVLARDPKVWAEAFDRQVFMTGQQNLMAILRVIQIAWRQYAQTESQKKVFDLAEELMKRVGEFIKRFDKVRKDIDTLKKDYEEAHNKAYSGRQSIVQKANELKELGVKESLNLPIPEAEIALPEEGKSGIEG